MIDLTGFQAMSFDCYGTLIDWQSGIVRAMRPILGERNIERTNEEILAAYSPLERVAQAGPYRPYRQVLRDVVRGYAGADTPEELCDGLAQSIPDWPAFDESMPALTRLARHYKLAIVSNIDEDLIMHSARKLGAEFETIVTAQAVRSYKPGLDHFKGLCIALRLEPSQILHVAESRHHDVEPAKTLGFRTVWVNRAEGGPSASGESDARPDLTVGSLMELADLVDQAFDA